LIFIYLFNDVLTMVRKVMSTMMIDVDGGKGRHVNAVLELS